MPLPENTPRSKLEIAFLIFFIPIVIAFYLIYKYPLWFADSSDAFYLFGKQPSFWYMSLYTLLVSGTCLWLLVRNVNAYSIKKNPEPLNKYQKGKFTAIFFSQTFAFYLIPFVILPFMNGAEFWSDPAKMPVKTAHVYLWPAFTSVGVALYVFVFISVIVYFFGKRYCSWFCSCGNLAETVGVTPWGRRWVRKYTPRSEKSRKLEIIQRIWMVFAIITGIILLMDALNFAGAENVAGQVRATQDFITDLIFGSLIGVGFYPFLGTRIWCRYGCPLAGWMHVLGQKINTRFRVEANDKCRGIGQCTTTCPMGIPVEDFAHKDKQPIQGSFGLDESPCIGCGGCISACPTKALSFR